MIDTSCAKTSWILKSFFYLFLKWAVLLKDTCKNVWNSLEEKCDLRDLNFPCFPSAWAAELEGIRTVTMKTISECLPPCLHHLSRLSNRNSSIFFRSIPHIVTDYYLPTGAFKILSFLYTSLYRQIKTLTQPVWCSYQLLFSFFTITYLKLIPLLLPFALSSPLEIWNYSIRMIRNHFIRFN